MSEWKKPLVFNYGDYERLRDQTERQAEEIAKLKAENEQVKEILNQMRIKLRIMEGNNDNDTRQQNSK